MTGRHPACRTTRKCAKPISAAGGLPQRGPAVLLEVANLDVRYGRNHAVKKLNLSVDSDGLAILLVEQNTHMALEVASRGLVMELGSVVLEGAADVLRDDERLAAAYLGGH